MYWLPSASQMSGPLPRTIHGGSPPTARKARTGESTPPGITLSARCCSLRESSVLRGKKEIYHEARRHGEGEVLCREGHLALPQLDSASQESGGEQRRGESQVHERARGDSRDADEVDVGRGVHRADVPRDDEERFEEFAGAAPDAEGERGGRDERCCHQPAKQPVQV